jgi:hypothetical protein
MHRFLIAAAAVFLTGCGVDYEKCEAIRKVIARAESDVTRAKDIVYEKAQSSHVNKYCGDRPYDTDMFLSYLRCTSETNDKYLDQSVKASLEHPSVIAEASRRDKIIADFKRNRCE